MRGGPARLRNGSCCWMRWGWFDAESAWRVTILRSALHDADESVRECAAKLARSSRPESSGTYDEEEDARSALRDLMSEHHFIWRKALQTLVENRFRPAESVEILKELSECRHPQAAFMAATALAVSEDGPWPTLESALPYLTSHKDGERVAAVKCLVHYAQTGDEKRRKCVARRAVDALERPDEDCQLGGAEVLAALPAWALASELPAIERRARELAGFYRRLHRPYPVASALLSVIWNDRMGESIVLRMLMESDELFDEQFAQGVMASLPAPLVKTGRVRNRILEAVTDSDFEWRRAALRAMRGVSCPHFLRASIESLHDDAPTVVVEAIRTLAVEREFRSSAMAALRKRLDGLVSRGVAANLLEAIARLQSQ